MTNLTKIQCATVNRTCTFIWIIHVVFSLNVFNVFFSSIHNLIKFRVMLV